MLRVVGSRDSQMVGFRRPPNAGRTGFTVKLGRRTRRVPALARRGRQLL